MLPSGATCSRTGRAFANSVNRQWIANATGWLKPAIPFPPGNSPRSLGGPQARGRTLLTNSFLKIVRLTVPAQPVDATQALNLSAGVSNCKVSRGRSLS